jgi:hypothetical protein
MAGWHRGKPAGHSRVSWPHLIALGMALICGSAGQAQSYWRVNGKPVGADPKFASSGEFAIQQIATLDGEGLSQRWNQPSAGVVLASASTMLRNQPIFTFIVFTGCKPDQSGSCNVTAQSHMFDPSGKPWGSSLDAPVWVGLPPPAKDILQLSSQYLGMVVEDKDPLGPYRVETVVTDNVAHITLHTQQILTAVATKDPSR